MGALWLTAVPTDLAAKLLDLMQVVLSSTDVVAIDTVEGEISVLRCHDIRGQTALRELIVFKDF